MQFRYGLVAAWVVATFASMLVAFAAVGSVRSAIEDPPAALLLSQDAPSAMSLPPVSSLPQSTFPDPEVDDGAPVSHDDGVVEEPTSAETTATRPPASTGPPPQTTQAPKPVSTTAAPVTTAAPTTAPPTERVDTYETAGGWVTVRASEEGVFLESASPKPGWTVETEGRGPEHFTVVFKGDDEEIHVAVSSENGEVDVDIED